MLREVVADALERISDVDDRLSMITVTAVDTSPDLRHATVFLSTLTDETAAALLELRAELQRSISRQVRLKRTPHLEFEPDPGVAHGARVEEILRHLHHHDPGADSDDDPGDER